MEVSESLQICIRTRNTEYAAHKVAFVFNGGLTTPRAQSNDELKAIKPLRGGTSWIARTGYIDRGVYE